MLASELIDKLQKEINIRGDRDVVANIPIESIGYSVDSGIDKVRWNTANKIVIIVKELEMDIV